VAALLVGLAAPPALSQSASSLTGGGSGESQQQSADSVVEPLKLVGEAASAPLREDHGSVDQPRWSGRRSPRELVMAFRENMRYLRQGKPGAEEQAWPRIKAMLDTSQLEPPDEAKLRAIAYDLDRVFDRLPLQPTRLAGRQAVKAQELHRVEVFPRAIGHEMIWSQLGKQVPDEEIVVEAGSDGRWVFAAETVAEAEALFKAVRPARLHDPEPWVKPSAQLESLARPTLERMSARQWVWAGGGLAVGLIAGLSLWWALRWAGSAITKRDRPGVGAMIGQLAGPLGLGVIFFGVAWALASLRLGPTLGEWRWRVVETLGAVIVVYAVVAAVGIVGAIAQRRADGSNQHFKKTAIPLLVTIVKMIVAALLLVVVLQMLLGVNVLATVAGFGLVGIAIGLAAQESVKNWFGAMTIFLSKPFTEGDWIVFKGQFGQVESIGLNATRLRIVDGEVLTVPNMSFIDEPISNATARKWLRRELNLSVAYDASPDELDRAAEIVRDALKEEAVTDQGGFKEIGREPHVTFANFAADHLDIRAYYWFRVPDGEAGWYRFLDHADTVNRTIYRRFDEAGLDFAFPTQTLRLRDEDGETVKWHGRLVNDRDVEDNHADDYNDRESDDRESGQATRSNSQNDNADEVDVDHDHDQDQDHDDHGGDTNDHESPPTRSTSSHDRL